jgi:hypothetical protein
MPVILSSFFLFFLWFFFALVLRPSLALNWFPICKSLFWEKELHAQKLQHSSRWPDPLSHHAQRLPPARPGNPPCRGEPPRTPSLRRWLSSPSPRWRIKREEVAGVEETTTSSSAATSTSTSRSPNPGMARGEHSRMRRGTPPQRWVPPRRWDWNRAARPCLDLATKVERGGRGRISRQGGGRQRCGRAETGEIRRRLSTTACAVAPWSGGPPAEAEEVASRVHGSGLRRCPSATDLSSSSGRRRQREAETHGSWGIAEGHESGWEEEKIETPGMMNEREADGGIFILQQALGILLKVLQWRLSLHFEDRGWGNCCR